MRPRSSGELVESIANWAIPSIGSQPIASKRSVMAAVRLLGVPAWRPPVFLPIANRISPVISKDHTRNFLSSKRTFVRSLPPLTGGI
jgi:hypothetical protein